MRRRMGCRIRQRGILHSRELLLYEEKIVAEIEIHHEHGHGHEGDEFGKTIGVIVGIIGIVLAAITISSHRAHTAAVIYRTEANDQWAFFQSKKISEHAADNTALILSLLSSDRSKVDEAITKLNGTRDRY